MFDPCFTSFISLCLSISPFYRAAYDRIYEAGRGFRTTDGSDAEWIDPIITCKVRTDALYVSIVYSIAHT